MQEAAPQSVAEKAQAFENKVLERLAEIERKLDLEG